MTRYSGPSLLSLVALIIALPFFAPVAGAQTASFIAPRDFPVGTSPNSVAVGDLNGDSVPDLAVANFSASGLSVMLGKPDGTMQPEVRLTAGARPHWVSVGDLNGDGKRDLVTANFDSNDVSVLIGHGDGTFQAAQSFAAGTNPAFVGVADLNGDGKEDLTATNYGSADISVLLGHGDGTFQAAVTYPTGTNAHWAAFGDLNRDGKKDLVVANVGTGFLSVLMGNGDGTFQAAWNLSVGSAPASVAATDFNGDGNLDLAVANYGWNSLMVLLGNGNGTFQAAQSFPTGSGPWGLVAADLDNDGRPDVAVAHFGFDNNSTITSIFLGNGDGTLRAAGTVGPDIRPTHLAVADFNADGTRDLAVVNFGGNAISMVLGNGDGTFRVARTFAVGANPMSASVADFDGDHVQDLAVGNNGSSTVSLLRGNGDGTFAAAQAFATGAGPRAVATADFNGDGHPDLATANYNSQDVSVMLGNGDGTLLPGATFGVGPGPTSLAVGDLNGDGKVDLAAANSGSNTVSVLLGTGGGTFQAALTATAGGGSDAVAMGDVNGDGKLDLAVSNYGPSSVSVLLGNGDGTFQAPLDFATGANPIAVAVGDVSGDGKLDLAVANINGNSVSVLLGNGNGTFAAAAHYAAGTAPFSVAMTDFNLDGKTDVVAANSGATTVSVLIGNGNGTFKAAVHFAAGSGAMTAAIGDFNRDGTPDLAVPSYYTNAVSVLLGSNGSLPATAAPVFTPAGGTYLASVVVTLTDSTPGATIYYTTDGSVPTTASAAYAGPIAVTQTTTIRAIAAANGMSNSGEASATYTIQNPVATPVLSPAGGTYVGPQTVTISDATSGATIYYTTDGSTPTAASTPYSGPISVTQNTTIRAMASKSGMTDSSVASATYTIQQQVVATPVLSPASGTFITSVTVTIADSTPGAAIHYTTDGSTPTAASTPYGGPISVTLTTTIRAMASKSGMTDSSVAGATYTARVPGAAEDFAVLAGSAVTCTDCSVKGDVGVDLGGTVTRTNGTIWGTVHEGDTVAQQAHDDFLRAYTDLAAEPCGTFLPVLSGQTLLPGVYCVNAAATETGGVLTLAGSPTDTWIFKIGTGGTGALTGTNFRVVMPGGTTCDNNVFWWTAEAATLTDSVFLGSILAGTSVTVTRGSLEGQTLAKAEVTLTGPSVCGPNSDNYSTAAPEITPASGTYLSSVTVTMTDSTPGATIHYTIDGSTPTTSSTSYTGPISVTQTRTIRAMAAASGKVDSVVASATYTIKLAMPTFGLASGTFNTPQTATISASTGAAIYYTIDGSTPTTSSTLYTGPISVTQTSTIRAIAAASGMVNSEVAAATYTLQAATPVFDPPSRSFILPLSVSISSASPGVTIYYTTDGSTPTTSSTRYTGPITVVFTTTIKAIAVRTGWTSSPVASATYTLLGM